MRIYATNKRLQHVEPVGVSGFGSRHPAMDSSGCRGWVCDLRVAFPMRQQKLQCLGVTLGGRGHKISGDDVGFDHFHHASVHIDLGGGVKPRPGETVSEDSPWGPSAGPRFGNGVLPRLMAVYSLASSPPSGDEPRAIKPGAAP